MSEETANASWFDRMIYKVLTWLKLTSGIGIVGIGGFWLLYGLLNYIFVKPTSAFQQQVAETYFLQAEVGLVIVGIIIMEIKKNRDKEP